MRLQTAVVLGLLAGVVGCDDTSSPVAPTPVVAVVPLVPPHTYVPVHRGRCPDDSELPFSVREAGWFWTDTCRNNHGVRVQLSDWCSGTRSVDMSFCVLNTADPPPPPPPSTLTVTGPHGVPDNGCVEYSISGGTAPYGLTSYGGRWVTSAPCQSSTPTRYTLMGPGRAVWSATGLDAGDSAQVSVTDADGERKTVTVNVS